MPKLIENVTIKRRLKDLLKDLRDVQVYLDDLSEHVWDDIQRTKAVVEAIRIDIEWAIEEHDAKNNPHKRTGR